MRLGFHGSMARFDRLRARTIHLQPGVSSGNYNPVTTPIFNSAAFNILKRTQLTERVDLLFQMSFLDAFNRHIFDDPQRGPESE